MSDYLREIIYIYIHLISVIRIKTGIIDKQTEMSDGILGRHFVIVGLANICQFGSFVTCI